MSGAQYDYKKLRNHGAETNPDVATIASPVEPDSTSELKVGSNSNLLVAPLLGTARRFEKDDEKYVNAQSR